MMSSTFKLTVEDVKKRSGREDTSDITQLDLSNLGLTCVPADVLKQLTNLEELNLSKNKLTEVEHEGVNLPHLKILDISNNQLRNVEGLSAFPNLENLNVVDNNTLEVSDKYKLVSLSPFLKILDGKDISLMREAVNRLDATMSEKIDELWKQQFSNKFQQLKDENRSKFENDFIEKLKTEVTCGPPMLKSYREYKLAILGKRHLRRVEAECKVEEGDPPRKKQKTNEVNGNTDETETRYVSDAEKNSKIRTPESKVNRKRDRPTPHKVMNKQRPLECHFAVSHLLQTHSLNNDPTDRKTQVWGCEFEPDPERQGHTTTTCATCGGDSVCFVDCTTGRVMKKYKQPGETFYCLAWTTVTMDLGDGKKKRANLIAAGGSQNDIKIIEPTQLVCFEEIKGHKGVLECLMFHPHHPTWLLSAADDTIMVWEVGLPKGTEYESSSSLLLTLRSRSIVRSFCIPPHGKVVVGACDDGCYVWKLFESKIEKTKDKTRTHCAKMDFPGKKIIPLDSVACLSDNLVATKRVEEGCIHIWYSESEMMTNDFKLAYKLPWRDTEVPFLKFTFVPACCVLLAGDNEGSVWMYDIEPCTSEARAKEKQVLKQTQILSCPNETTRVFNQVSASSSLDYIVAVADTNVVCIWKRLNDDAAPESS